MDESPSEDVRQARHRGGTHVSGPSKAHREETRRELCGSREAAGLAAAGAGALLPLPSAIACPLQAAPRGGSLLLDANRIFLSGVGSAHL